MSIQSIKYIVKLGINTLIEESDKEKTFGLIIIKFTPKKKNSHFKLQLIVTNSAASQEITMVC